METAQFPEPATALRTERRNFVDIDDVFANER
jgi:hypothetical protein